MIKSLTDEEESGRSLIVGSDVVARSRSGSKDHEMAVHLYARCLPHSYCSSIRTTVVNRFASYSKLGCKANKQLIKEMLLQCRNKDRNK